MPELVTLPGVVFDRTPLDYLDYLAAAGADLSAEANTAALRPALASLDLLVITVITAETERALSAPEMPGLRSQMKRRAAGIGLRRPAGRLGDIAVLELSGPLDGRLDAVLAALDQRA